MDDEASRARAWCRVARADGSWVAGLGGRWILANIIELEHEVAALSPEAGAAVRIDLAAVEALDTAGAWLIYRLARRLAHVPHRVEISGASDAQTALLGRMAPTEGRRPLMRPYNPLRDMVERVGQATINVLGRARDLVSFFGLTAIVFMRAAIRPRRLRFISLLSHLERVGLNALPIVGLLSFLIGVVLAYQGADQLRQFGAEIYTVNLLGVSVLREIGILMTAILVAGRSGSAFTAEIGMMKVNEEVAAMQTIGVDPMEVLVLPRVLATVIALPLLCFYANMMSLLGGAIMSYFALGISVEQFLVRLKDAITVSTLWVGMVKAPFFAFLIGMVGCYEGLKVEGSAESVGRLTTKAVVEAIFLVIVADAGFSILFSYLGI